MRGSKGKARLGRPARALGERPTKERILEAAIELFARLGYDRTSMRQVAEAVGITEAAVYRHFEGKGAILEAIVDYMERQVSAPLPELEPGDSSSIFRRMLAPLPRAMAADPNIVRIARIMYAELHHDERIREYLREGVTERAVDAVEALLREEIAGGRLRCGDPRALARFVNSFRAEWVFETFVLDRSDDHDASRLARDLEPQIELLESLWSGGRAEG